MIKKKGQIVPRWLIKSIERKAQHLVKFGCDVEIYRGSREVKALSDGCVFYIPSTRHVLKKKNPVSVKGFVVKDIKVTGYKAFAIERD